MFSQFAELIKVPSRQTSELNLSYQRLLFGQGPTELMIRDGRAATIIVGDESA